MIFFVVVLSVKFFFTTVTVIQAYTIQIFHNPFQIIIFDPCILLFLFFDYLDKVQYGYHGKNGLFSDNTERTYYFSKKICLYQKICPFFLTLNCTKSIFLKVLCPSKKQISRKYKIS